VGMRVSLNRPQRQSFCGRTRNYTFREQVPDSRARVSSFFEGVLILRWSGCRLDFGTHAGEQTFWKLINVWIQKQPSGFESEVAEAQSLRAGVRAHRRRGRSFRKTPCREAILKYLAPAEGCGEISRFTRWKPVGRPMSARSSTGQRTPSLMAPFSGVPLSAAWKALYGDAASMMKSSPPSRLIARIRIPDALIVFIADHISIPRPTCAPHGG